MTMGISMMGVAALRDLRLVSVSVLESVVSRQSSVGRPYAKKGNWFVVLIGFNDIPAQFVLPWVRIDIVRCICNVNEGQLMCCWSREVVRCHGCLMCYDTCCHDVERLLHVVSMLCTLECCAKNIFNPPKTPKKSKHNKRKQQYTYFTTITTKKHPSTVSCVDNYYNKLHSNLRQNI